MRLDVEKKTLKKCKLERNAYYGIKEVYIHRGHTDKKK